MRTIYTKQYVFRYSRSYLHQYLKCQHLHRRSSFFIIISRVQIDYLFWPIACLHPFRSVLSCPIRFPRVNGVWLVFRTICFVKEVLFYFCYLYLFTYITLQHYYPLANEVAMGYSNATVRPSVRPPVTSLWINILQWMLTKLRTNLVLRRI